LKTLAILFSATSAFWVVTILRASSVLVTIMCLRWQVSTFLLPFLFIFELFYRGLLLV
jgi:hypothetical protein